MQATIEKIEDNHAHLEIVVPPEDVEKALNRAYRKVARNVSIPGFRKGKAPRRLVERHVGREVLHQEALEVLLPEAYSRAVSDTGIEPIDQPEVSDVEIKEGEPLAFKAVVEVKPEVNLGDYQQIRVEREEQEVGSDEVDRVLEQLREQQAQLVAVADGTEAAKGHYATIDFKGTIDGEPFEGGTAENYVVEIGAGQLLDEFEAQLPGMKVGETREIQVAFPDDFGSEELAGRQASFTVTLKELKEKELPALDDEFARSLGEFQSLEELRADVENTLSQRATEEADRQLRQKVIEQVAEQAEVDVPQVLVERRIEQLVNEFKQRLEASNLNLDAYLQHQGQTLEDFKETFRQRAEQDVKSELVLEAVARQEQIEPDEKDFAAEAARLAETHNQKTEDISRLLERPEVRADLEAVLRIRKTVDHLVSIATASE